MIVVLKKLCPVIGKKLLLFGIDIFSKTKDFLLKIYIKQLFLHKIREQINLKHAINSNLQLLISFFSKFKEINEFDNEKKALQKALI